MSLRSLRDNHQLMIGLSGQIIQKNIEFFKDLSSVNDFNKYLKKIEKMNDDKDRAKFICALAKNVFLVKGGIPVSYTVKVDKSIFHSDEGLNWEVNLQFDTYGKTIDIYASYFNWHTYKVKYKFDFFCLYNNELLNEKVEGLTKYEYYNSHSNGPINPAELNRNDEDIRIIIDSLFKYLKGC